MPPVIALDGSREALTPRSEWRKRLPQTLEKVDAVKERLEQRKTEGALKISSHSECLANSHNM
jgi:hypothetical protein